MHARKQYICIKVCITVKAGFILPFACFSQTDKSTDKFYGLIQVKDIHPIFLYVLDNLKLD